MIVINTYIHIHGPQCIAADHLFKPAKLVYADMQDKRKYILFLLYI